MEDIIKNVMNDLKVIQQQPSNSASRSGKGVGRGALLQKGINNFEGDNFN